MKSGLYACAGASATASAAACANRFDDPITNESNVYLGLSVPLESARCFGGSGAGGTPSGCSRTSSLIVRSWPVTSPCAAAIKPRKWPSIQSRVKSLGMLRTNSEFEILPPSTSSNHVRYVVSFRAPRSRLETSCQTPSAVSSIGRFTPRAHSLSRVEKKREHSNAERSPQCPFGGYAASQKSAICRDFRAFPHHSPQLWTRVSSDDVPDPFAACRSRSPVRNLGAWPVDKVTRGTSSILACEPPARRRFFLPSSPREADLPAQRSASEAQARLPCSHVDAGRAGDSETAAGARAQTPLRVAGRRVSTPVERRHRLSRSKDFDAVYRQGRSVSTRFLVLHWFTREDGDDEPRLGLAVPRAVGTAVVRNKMKRRLRELWRSRLDQLPRGRDYVLVVRPGLPEAVESRGVDWLGDRVDQGASKGGPA